jgi:hypothetical protein
VLADILGRVVSLIDSLLSERVSNASSVRLMEHAAKLDLDSSVAQPLKIMKTRACEIEILSCILETRAPV